MSRPRGASRRAPARSSSSTSRDQRVAAPVVSELESALQRSAALPSPEPTPFTELGLPPKLVTALERSGLTTAFEIQARVLPDAGSHLAKLKTGAAPLMALPAEAF